MATRSRYVGSINSYVTFKSVYVGIEKVGDRPPQLLQLFSLMAAGGAGPTPPLDRRAPKPPASPKRTVSTDVSPGRPRDRRTGRPPAGATTGGGVSAGCRLEGLQPRSYHTLRGFSLGACIEAPNRRKYDNSACRFGARRKGADAMMKRGNGVREGGHAPQPLQQGKQGFSGNGRPVPDLKLGPLIFFYGRNWYFLRG